MNKSESQANIIEQDELNYIDETNEKIKLLNKIKRQFNLEFNGLFYIILSIIVLAVSLTVAMILSIFYGPPQIRPHAAISTEVPECSELGLDICKNGGSAVDSAIASMLCLTVVRPDIASIGGCGSMLIHNHTSMVSDIIDFSCVSPLNPNTSTISSGFFIKESVAIPGILSGLKLAHKKYGKINWTNLLKFVIDKLEKGVKVTKQMRLTSSSSQFNQLPVEFKLLYKDWTTSEMFKPSSNILQILRNLQTEGPISGISGSLANEIINLGFSWTGQFDTARIQKPIKALFGDFLFVTSPLPSKGGLDLALSVEILNKLIPKNTIKKESSFIYHIILETLKVVQAFTSFLGDSSINIENLLSPSSINSLVKRVNVTVAQTNQYYGPYYRLLDIEMTSGTHISVIDPTNLYVSLSVNMGSKFGSGLMTKSGIILNDALRLFTPNELSYLVPGLQSLNNTNSNNIAASGKRPLNQLTPLMIYNVKRKCGIRFAIGGDHGSKATTGSLQMILSAIFLDQKFCPSKDCLELQNAGKKPRLHINILNNNNISSSIAKLYVESSFSNSILMELVNVYKHSNYIKVSDLQSLYSIGKVQYEIQGFADSRGGGQFLYF